MSNTLDITRSREMNGKSVKHEQPIAVRRTIYFTEGRANLFQTAFESMVNAGHLPKNSEIEENRALIIDTAIKALIESLNAGSKIVIAELSLSGWKHKKGKTDKLNDDPHAPGTRRSFYFTKNRAYLFETAFQLLINADYIPATAEIEATRTIMIDTALQCLIKKLQPGQ